MKCICPWPGSIINGLRSGIQWWWWSWWWRWGEGGAALHGHVVHKSGASCKMQNIAGQKLAHTRSDLISCSWPNRIRPLGKSVWQTNFRYVYTVHRNCTVDPS